MGGARFLDSQSFVVLSFPSIATMQNNEGEIVDLYIPRKCTVSNRVIKANDHASVQLNIGHLDASGVYTGQYTAVSLVGYVRQMGEADMMLDNLWKKKKSTVGQA